MTHLIRFSYLSQRASAPVAISAATRRSCTTRAPAARRCWPATTSGLSPPKEPDMGPRRRSWCPDVSSSQA